jgi:seryl-tRNA synthetase
MTPEHDTQALLLCFKLQDSRIVVVSSTVAATLRQLVMFVVNKMVEEGKQDSVDPKLLEDVTLPDGTMAALGPFAQDTYAVFKDLCLLANLERPHFLNREYLHKMFTLELIISVLTNYHELFRKVYMSLLSMMFILDRAAAQTTSDVP